MLSAIRGGFTTRAGRRSRSDPRPRLPENGNDVHAFIIAAVFVLVIVVGVLAQGPWISRWVKKRQERKQKNLH